MKVKITLSAILTAIIVVVGIYLFPRIVFGTPIQISTCQGLQNINLDVTAAYELSGDIDCTFDTQNVGGALYNGGSGFLPINSFSGTLDGKNHTITGLKINRPGVSAGLFRDITTGTVSNIELISVNITGNSTVGALAGSNGGTVTNSSSTGTVSGSDVIGGLIGSSSTALTGLHSSATVTGTANSVGGLVGTATSTISNSYATGNVSGGAASGFVGGLVGQAFDSVTNSYATGTVNGTNTTGGLIGYSSSAGVSASNSYATGSVTGGDNTGGLIGQADGTVTLSYATGNVLGTNAVGFFNDGNEVGGLIGLAGGDVSNSYARGTATGNFYVGSLIGLFNATTVSTSYGTGLVTGNSSVGGLIGATFTGVGSYAYWDKTTTNQTTSAGSANSYGKTTAEMKTQSTFVTWDFSTIWAIDLTAAINNGYPYFIWQTATPTPAPTTAATPTPTPPVNPPGPVTCDVPAPPLAPILFQAVRTGSKVKLWYTPVNINTTGYAIIYGYFPGDERFGVMFDQGFSSGALTYEIGHLDPKNTYTFKIQAKNGCASGPWSNYISVAALSSGPAPGPKSSPSPTSIPSSSPSGTPTSTPRTTPTLTPTPFSTPTETPMATESASPTATISGEPTFTPVPTSGTDVISVIETHHDDIANITDTAAATGVGVVTVIAFVEVTAMTVAAARTLPFVYEVTARPLYMVPIDYIGSVGQGMWLLITGFFGPLFGFVRKRPGAGKVFDAINGKPIFAAFVVLFSDTGNLKTGFTDKFGQYELTPKPDIYNLKIDKDLYSFPSRVITVSQTVSYTRIYVPGEKFEIKNNGEKFNYLGIPVDPVKHGSTLAASFAKARQIVSFILSVLIPVLEVAAVLISGLAAATNPGLHYKLIFLIISVFAFYDIVGRVIVSRASKA